MASPFEAKTEPVVELILHRIEEECLARSVVHEIERIVHRANILAFDSRSTRSEAMVTIWHVLEVARNRIGNPKNGVECP